MKQKVSLFGTRVIVTVREIVSIAIAIISIVWGAALYVHSDANFKQQTVGEIRKATAQLMVISHTDSIQAVEQTILNETMFKCFDMIGIPFDSIYKVVSFRKKYNTRSVEYNTEEKKKLSVVVFKN